MKSLPNTLLALAVACLSLLVGCLPSPGKSASDASGSDVTTADVVATLPTECQQNDGTYCVTGEIRDFFSGELLTEIGNGAERIFLANVENLFTGVKPACGALFADGLKWDDFEASCTLGGSVTIEAGRFVIRGVRWNDASQDPQLVLGYDATADVTAIRFTPVIQPLYGYRQKPEHVVGAVIYTIGVNALTKMYNAFPIAKESLDNGVALARVIGVDDKSGWIVSMTGDVLVSTYPCNAVGCLLFGPEHQPTNEPRADRDPQPRSGDEEAAAVQDLPLRPAVVDLCPPDLRDAAQFPDSDHLFAAELRLAAVVRATPLQPRRRVSIRSPIRR